MNTPTKPTPAVERALEQARVREQEDFLASLRLMTRTAARLARKVETAVTNASAYAEHAALDRTAGALVEVPDELERLRSLVVAALELHRGVGK